MPLPDEVLAMLKAGQAKVKASRQDITDALRRQPHPDPLAEVRDSSTGDLEADVKAELDALGKGLSGASKQWAEKFAAMNDSEYWIAICFRSREQKEEFLRKAELTELGDKYLDGEKAAEILGIELDEQ
ncbi:hypothetical protein [Nocardia transvalensis]|uniref:hypothetical protein n=1 Tax=Nocardia transvalensis TaxID=37333 RepID=UPI0018941F60|nr:hypothetical protein [Nocardia transvalensis]MBF6333335.1 hypothetical protein [Nocardia transvalensis]